MKLRPLWTGRPFSTGYMVAALALVAVIMASRTDSLTTTEKVMWIMICAVFFGWELHLIDRDNEQRDHQHFTDMQTQQYEFDATTGKLTDALDRLAKVLDREQKAIGRVNEAINTETGGGTFCFLDFTFMPTWENGKETSKGYWWFDAVRVGKYPLRNVSMTVDDNTKYGAVMSAIRKQDTRSLAVPAEDKIPDEMEQAERATTTNLPVGDFAIERKSLGSYPVNEGEVQEFNVLVRTFNQPTSLERAELKRTRGHWAKAILVELPPEEGRKRKLWTRIDADFPRKDGHLDVNWPRPVKGRASWDH